MKPRSLARPGRIVLLAALLLSFAVGSAPAQHDPPQPPPPIHVPPLPLDTLGLPFIDHVLVGGEGCITCPPRPSPDENALVSVAGLPAVACYSFRALPQLRLR